MGELTFERACASCGFTWNGGLGVQRPALSIDLKFCSRACLKAWEAKLPFSQFEIEAIEKVLPDLGQHVARNGLGSKAFNDCSRDEILGIVAASVRTFRKELHEIFDREGIAF